MKNQIADKKTDGKSGRQSSQIAGSQGSHGGSHGGGLQGFMIHLGSTGCKAEGNNQKPTSCATPNKSKVIFSNFDSTKNTVIADLESLVSQTNLAANQVNTPPGCMSEPTDGDCAGIMKNLGLPFGDKPTGGQTFFKIK